jgi:hypothetical protein
MSLKFAALGSLTVLSALGTPARADDQAQNLRPVAPHEPILITFGWRSSAAEPKKPEAGVIMRFLMKARQAPAAGLTERLARRSSESSVELDVCFVPAGDIAATSGARRYDCRRPWYQER